MSFFGDSNSLRNFQSNPSNAYTLIMSYMPHNIPQVLYYFWDAFIYVFLYIICVHFVSSLYYSSTYINKILQT